MNSTSLVKLNQIRKEYKTLNSSLVALNNVNLTISKGEFVSVMGPSGSGKSTLLNIIGLLDSYDSGEYLLKNKSTIDLSDNGLAEIRNKTLGFVFQSFNLLPHRNALENVSLPLFYQGISYKERNERACPGGLTMYPMSSQEDRSSV